MEKNFRSRSAAMIHVWAKHTDASAAVEYSLVSGVSRSGCLAVVRNQQPCHAAKIPEGYRPPSPPAWRLPACAGCAWWPSSPQASPAPGECTDSPAPHTGTRSYTYQGTESPTALSAENTENRCCAAAGNGTADDVGSPRLMYLKDRTNKDGVCWPSIKTIARELHLSRATVQRALNDLCAAGYLSKENRWRENGGWAAKRTRY